MARHGGDVDAVTFVVRKLREWGTYPGYSVERRLDLLLAPYLAQALTAKMKAPVELVAAEFPLPHRLFQGEGATNQHIAADFLCVRRGSSPAWILVELKTDRASRRDEQLSAYRAICSAGQGMSHLLETLRAVKENAPDREGYLRLIRNVRRAAGDAESIELCLVEPTRAGSSGPRPGETVVGLRELTELVEPDAGDPLWPELSKLLRGLARSDKARRPRRGAPRRVARVA